MGVVISLVLLFLCYVIGQLKSYISSQDACRCAVELADGVSCVRWHVVCTASHLNGVFQLLYIYLMTFIFAWTAVLTPNILSIFYAHFDG